MNMSKASSFTAATKAVAKRLARRGMHGFVCAAVMGMLAGRAEAQVQAWTPSNITVAAWYDAADAGTVLTNGSSVTNWLDKSGNNLHLSQGSSSPRATG